MKSNTDPIPDIRELNLADLIVDPTLSGRTPKEIKDNAKELAVTMKANKGWDATQPGAIFFRDNKPHLVRGFTRHAAALSAEIKTGYFAVVPDDPAKIRTEAIRSNLGKPISQYEQGRIFAGMRDGNELTELAVGEVALPAMSQKEIASDIGIHESNVSRALAIYESPEAVREMLLTDEVSAAVVLSAKKLAKGDEGKQVKILRAAIKHAKERQATSATAQDFDAVKGEFAPPLKAAEAGGKPEAEKKPKAADVRKADDPEQPEQPEDNEPEQDQAPLDLGPITPAPKKQSKKSAKEEREFLIAVLTKADIDEIHASLSEEDTALFVDAILSAGFRLVETPI